MFQKVRLFFLFDNSAPSNVLFLQKVRHQVSFLTHSAISKYLFDKILPSSYPPAKCAVKFSFYQQCSVKFFVSQKVRRQGLFSLKSAPKSKKIVEKCAGSPSFSITTWLVIPVPSLPSSNATTTTALTTRIFKLCPRGSVVVGSEVLSAT